ncbi:MAG: sulfotransferase domain-containing protein [Bacteroidota bacterium]
MDELKLQQQWQQQAKLQQKWQQQVKETNDGARPVEMADGSVVDPQVYIVSFPKSGRTWLRTLIGKALIDGFALNTQDLLEPLKLTVSAGVLPTEFIHDGTNAILAKPWTELESDKSSYKDKKVIFLVREPKDLIVSFYFSTTRRKQIYEGSISEFIRSDEYGIKKIMTFYKNWCDNQNVPKDFFLLRYEDLHKDAETCLASVLKFIAAENIPKQVIKDAVDFGDFENMKQLERSGQYSWRLLPANASDEQSYKVRQGKVGGYVDYLSKEDIEYIDGIIAQANCSFF